MVLTVTAFRRLRAARVQTSITGEGLAVTAMTIAIACGVGMLALIGRDSVLGGLTFATGVTVVALAAVAALFLGGLAWASGTGVYRVHWRASVIVLAFVTGLIALIVQWKPPNPAIIGIAAVIAILGGYAAASELERDPATRPYRFPATVAMASVLVAGVARGADALVRQEPWPAAWLIAALVVVGGMMRLVAPRAMRTWRIVGYAAFLGYCILVCYLAERALIHAGVSSAGAALSSADMVFDLLVISVVQSRFADLGDSDAAAVTTEYITEQEHRENPRAYLGSPISERGRASAPDEVVADMVPMGLAVGIGLLVLLAAAAKPLGLDHGATRPASIRLLIVAAPPLLLCMLASNTVILKRWRAQAAEPQISRRLTQLDLPRWYWLLPTIGALLWLGLMLTLSGGTPRVPLIGGLAALLMFGLVTKSLAWGTTRIQTLTPTRGQLLIGTLVGAATATATFWLISYGMWEDGRPIAGGWLSATVLVVFLANVALSTLTGWTFATGLPNGRRTQQILDRENAYGYAVLDSAIFNVVLAVGVLIPLYAAVRDSALGVSPLRIVASMVFVPGFVGAVIWGLHNWKTYDLLIQNSRSHGLSRVVLARCDGQWDDAHNLDTAWRRNFHYHIESQRLGVAALATLGLLELLQVLLQ
jgi:hypothetical protein